MFQNPFMEEAIKEAKKALSLNEVPVGAILVNSESGKIISRSHNLSVNCNNAILHAELNVMMKACKKLKTKYLSNCDLYVTLEPCTMCAAAISMYRIKRLFYSALDSKFGAVESNMNFFKSKNCFHTPEIYSGIYEDIASKMMKDFFKSVRLYNKTF